MPSTPTIDKHEQHLRGYYRPEDGDSLEPARERARRAAAGEVVRRRVEGEDELRVRQLVDGKVTTAAGPRVVLDHHGHAVAKREDVEP